jgi:hypothetical protein
MMSREYSEFLLLAGEVIRGTIEDYLNYKKSQIVLYKYHKKDNFCTACGTVNKRELEAIITISEHEEIRRNKQEMVVRFKNSKKTA